ncbi:hypothetical protein GCM10027290_03540 [Micromonospora sonneratiae]|uniref:Uncharacterized protein n=1 Tax=Micromonospora sonneratiae TaxID=1184706 RepID=A0ABW3Y7E1_9ACTN
MSARKQPGNRTGSKVNPQAGGGSAPKGGPESPEPWGTTGSIDRNPPWGVGEDSPLDEGSEPAAVPPGRRGEQRAGSPAGPSGPAGRHGFGTVEPSRVPMAGPGAPPDPAPRRRTYPNDTATGDLPDNSIEEQTGMHPEGVSRRSSR